MDLEFLPPELRRIDLIVGEVLVLPLAEGERPPGGTLGLIDYRLGGKVSQRIQSGELTGALGEVVSLPLRPKLAVDRALIIGVGQPGTLNPSVLAGLIDLIAHELLQLGARRAVVELPGRASGEIDVDVAIDVLFERVGGAPEFDTWTLLENASDVRKLTRRLRPVRTNRWGARS